MGRGKKRTVERKNVTDDHDNDNDDEEEGEETAEESRWKGKDPAISPLVLATLLESDSQRR